MVKTSEMVFKSKMNIKIRNLHQKILFFQDFFFPALLEMD